MALKQAGLQQVIAPANVETTDSPISSRVPSKVLTFMRQAILNVVIPLMIIAGFFELQVWFAGVLTSPVTEIMAVMSVVFEIAFLFLWNIILDSLNPVK